jgi:hypothetical protein
MEVGLGPLGCSAKGKKKYGGVRLGWIAQVTLSQVRQGNSGC